MDELIKQIIGGAGSYVVVLFLGIVIGPIISRVISSIIKIGVHNVEGLVNLIPSKEIKTDVKKFLYESIKGLNTEESIKMIETLCDGLKKTIKGNFDDIIIDAVKKEIIKEIKELK